METTSQSLLIRLREPSDHEAWERFVQLYGPLIYNWSRRVGLSPDDAAELVQDVMELLVRKIPGFRYDPSRSFRSWLKTVTINRWREHCRRKSLPMAEANSSELKRLPGNPDQDFWDNEYRTTVIQNAVEVAKADFRGTTWEACRRYVFGGESPEALARELGISVWTVYSAKSRLLKRLRQELDGLLD